MGKGRPPDRAQMTCAERRRKRTSLHARAEGATLRGDTLVFEIANTSSTTHNFTIKDPGGRIIESVDLPGKKSVSVEIPLPEAGTYEFYCDKPFHPAMGMKGRVHALLP